MTESILNPRFGKECMVHPLASVIGNVEAGSQCSFWPNSVVRGDMDSIKLGNRVNIQDNVTIHVDHNYPTVIGDDTTVGHNAVVHGCTIGKLCVIGIGSIVLNGARIGDGCIIGAGAVVTPGTEIPPDSLVMGIPGKVRRTDPELRKEAEMNSEIYVQTAREYLKRSFGHVPDPYPANPSP
jgi:carbonic anhydrase/acetyltransferase-like protein (isoleucine patch superfamily)